MMNPKIKTIKAREILDSRANPTLEVEIKVEELSVIASVPSGASRGRFEAKAIKTKKAIENINEIIAPKLIGRDPTNQREIDKILIELDGTKDKSKLGANAICGVSLAVCRAGAVTKNLPLYQYIREIYRDQTSVNSTNYNLPTAFSDLSMRGGDTTLYLRPTFNVLNGGVHAKNQLDLQEFMIVPQKERFSDNFELAKKVYQKLGKIIKQRYKKVEIGDEAGFSPPISKAKEALELIKKASDNFKDIKIILDCAASQFQKGNKYKIERKILAKKELLDFYQDLLSKYPILGLEDPFGEEDFEGWRSLSSKLKIQDSKLIIIGDDLTVTNPERIKIAKKMNLCNGVIIKINQIGTVSEAIEAVKLAKSFNWKIIVSHRSGETLDDFIADFAVGVGADLIKAGAPAKEERMAKYNRLLRIEEELK